MRIGSCLLSLLVLAIAAQTANGAGRIYRPIETSVYQVSRDGTRRDLLFRNSQVRNIGAVSPNRKRVLVQYGYQMRELYSAALPGNEVTPVASLPQGTYVEDAVWSPDGKQIAIEAAYSSCTGIAAGCASAGIWLAQADGSGLRLLVANAIAPSWSPDGRRLAYVGEFDAVLQRGRISVVNTKGAATERRIRPSERGHWDAWTVSWSPRGNLVAYSTGMHSRGHWDLRVTRATGNHRTWKFRSAKFGAWSPLGDRLLFWDLKSGKLAVSPSDGRRRRAMAAGALLSQPVAWSRNGRWIAYVGRTSSGGGCHQLFRVGSDKRGRRQLTHHSCIADYKPYWSLDDKRLIYTLIAYGL